MNKKSALIGTDQGLQNPTLSERFARLAELEADTENERAAIAKRREADLISLWKALVDHVESAGSSVEEVMHRGGFKLRRSRTAKQAAALPANKQKALAAAPALILANDPQTIQAAVECRIERRRPDVVAKAAVQTGGVAAA